MSYKVKQVIVIRKDLNMRKGKMVAQGAHASGAVIFNMMVARHKKGKKGEYTLKVPEAIREWLDGRFAKITVYVESEEQLISIYQQAKDAGIPSSLIIDAGLTEFRGVPTKTAVAVGPWWASEIDKITGELKLL